MIKDAINSILMENKELKKTLELLSKKKNEEHILIQNAEKDDNYFEPSTVNTLVISIQLWWLWI